MEETPKEPHVSTYFDDSNSYHIRRELVNEEQIWPNPQARRLLLRVVGVTADISDITQADAVAFFEQTVFPIVSEIRQLQFARNRLMQNTYGGNVAEMHRTMNSRFQEIRLFVAGQDLESIAKQLNLKVVTVRTNINRTLRILRVPENPYTEVELRQRLKNIQSLQEYITLPESTSVREKNASPGRLLGALVAKESFLMIEDQSTQSQTDLSVELGTKPVHEKTRGLFQKIVGSILLPPDLPLTQQQAEALFEKIFVPLFTTARSENGSARPDNMPILLEMVRRRIRGDSHRQIQQDMNKTKGSLQGALYSFVNAFRVAGYTETSWYGTLAKIYETATLPKIDSSTAQIALEKRAVAKPTKVSKNRRADTHGEAAVGELESWLASRAGTQIPHETIPNKVEGEMTANNIAEGLGSAAADVRRAIYDLRLMGKELNSRLAFDDDGRPRFHYDKQAVAEIRQALK